MSAETADHFARRISAAFRRAEREMAELRRLKATGVPYAALDFHPERLGQTADVAGTTDPKEATMSKQQTQAQAQDVGIKDSHNADSSGFEKPSASDYAKAAHLRPGSPVSGGPRKSTKPTAYPRTADTPVKKVPAKGKRVSVEYLG